jgi:hypothetical protein
LPVSTAAPAEADSVLPVSLVLLVRVVLPTDGALFSLLKSMTMIKNLWVFGRLPWFRPNPRKL